MEEKGVLAVFLVPIVAVILLGIIWSTVQTATVPTSVTNESFTGVENTYVALDNDNWAACSAVRNSTHHTLTETTDYVVDLSSGRLNMTTTGLAVNGTDNTTYADYTYKADSYVDSSMGRTIIGYLPLMAALVLLVFITGFIAMKKRE